MMEHVSGTKLTQSITHQAFLTTNAASDTPTILQILEAYFPFNYINSTMILQMKKHLEKPVIYGEFIKLIGLLFLMVATHLNHGHNFLSSTPSSLYGAPFPLKIHMSCHSFKAILFALKTQIDNYQYTKTNSRKFTIYWRMEQAHLIQLQAMLSLMLR